MKEDVIPFVNKEQATNITMLFQRINIDGGEDLASTLVLMDIYS